MPDETIMTQDDRDTLDALVSTENRRYIATHILAGIVDKYDPDNPHHVTRAADVAMRFADALLARLS